MRPTLTVMAQLAFLLASSVSSSAPPEKADVATDTLRAHMAFLGDDLLEGRGTGTRGHEIAARYVASRFQEIGLQPGAPDGGYFQRLALRQAVLVPERSSATVLVDGREEALVLGVDAGLAADLARETTSLEAPVVFVGYGVTAPALSRDDYAGIDAKGKIVVVVTGGPPAFPPAERAVLGSAREIALNAARHGAVGVVSIRTERDEKVLPWARSYKQLGQGSLAWLDEAGAPADVVPEIRATAILTPTGAAKLFAKSATTLEAALAALAAGKERAFPLGVSMRIVKASRHAPLSSVNVLAKLSGSDPRLKSELVVMTAHLDHLGIGEPVNGDSIYNGVFDNASGTAALLEVARVLAAGPAPARSILFASVTGEERGLLGSGYLAHHLPAPLESVVANLNLDGIPLHARARDLVARGAEHSTLGRDLEEVGRTLGLTVSPDPWPEQNFFVRSDQYSFVRRGIPSLWIKPGFSPLDGGPSLEVKEHEWRRVRYHAPSDDMSQPMDLEVAVDLARLHVLLVRRVANQPDRPRWDARSFFSTSPSR